MKRIVIIFLFAFFILSTNSVLAKGGKVKMPSVKFNGAKYTLYYSEKSKELNGFINEYYKQRENYANWSELIALHHYPQAFYPVEHARDFQEYLIAMGSLTFLEEDLRNDSAILDFTITNDNKLPIILEYNIFRYVKSPLCGTIGLQYAKRYRINNALEVKKVLSSINKTRKKQIKRLKKVKMPNLVTVRIDKGAYLKQEEPDLLKNNDESKEDSYKKIETTDDSLQKNLEKTLNDEEPTPEAPNTDQPTVTVQESEE